MTDSGIPASTRAELMRILAALNWDDLSLLGVTVNRSPDGLGDLILDEIVGRRSVDLAIDLAIAKATGENS